MFEIIGRFLARYLQKKSHRYTPVSVVSPCRLKARLQPGDVLLVEGNQRISVAIKYLTQSTWSHAAIYVGGAMGGDGPGAPCLIEADMTDGVIAVPMEKYQGLNTRICRPVGLGQADVQKLIANVTGKLGEQYDLRAAYDLMRYLLPQPPVPVRWRRRMLSLGSGDPTRAICSTLIGDAFKAIGYPILPEAAHRAETSGGDDRDHATTREIAHIHKTGLFAPRDFDLSPYFTLINPVSRQDFDYHDFVWAEQKNGREP